jgi:uncharacterized membrane protein
MSGKVLVVYGILVLIGFADAAYLSMLHFYQTDAGCSLITGCDAVLSSEYAVIAGVPLAYLGILYYLSLIITLMAYYQTELKRFLQGLFVLNTTGFIFSLWLVYVQAAILNAFCQYCLISAVISTILFFIVSYSLFVRQSSPDAPISG